MKYLFTVILGLSCLVGSGRAQSDLTRLFDKPSDVTDVRLGKPKDLNGYFPLEVPASKEAWAERAARVREQVLVGNGLWPLPERTPLNPVIRGKIDRGDYTVERAYFASVPGHYVTGSLYRPKSDDKPVKRPAVLCPHGHWPPEGPLGGRFHDAGEARAQADIKAGAEKTVAGARHPLQARCAQLARMGFVVFHYDMIGYADSQAIKHRTGFTDAEAELRLQSFMGMQTWNSIRALDFLESLPDVDPKRIAVTGASGGGTQTFILGGIDPRPVAAFPAVMVSTAMQGGCVCENTDFLRVGTGNIELAALFAPKPLGMSAANDWTKEIETKGLPELKALYRMLGAADKVDAKCWPQFGHNYNQVAREMMYAWFNKHVLGGSGEVAEKPFEPIPVKDLRVFDDAHPRPKDEKDAAELKKYLGQVSDKQIADLEPKDAKSLAEYRRVVGTALRVMLHDELPKPGNLEIRRGPVEKKFDGGAVMHLAAFSRKGAGETVPMAGMFTAKMKDTAVIWVHPNGKASLFKDGKIDPLVSALIHKGAAVVAPDVFQTGELQGGKPFPVNTSYGGFTYGYNRSVFGNRVRDILTAVTFARDMLKAKHIHIIGWEGAGPWALAARAMCGDLVERTAVDLNHFRFDTIKSVADENMLPGAVKYGGIGALLALCAPGEVLAHNHGGTSSGHLSKSAYAAAGAMAKLRREQARLSGEEVIRWILP